MLYLTTHSTYFIYKQSTIVLNLQRKYNNLGIKLSIEERKKLHNLYLDGN